MTEHRAVQALLDQGIDPASAQRAIESLRNYSIGLADDREGEFVVRWVDVRERSVPPEADTIIRTITRTVDGYSTSTTHWLAGLRGPRLQP